MAIGDRMQIALISDVPTSAEKATWNNKVSKSTQSTVTLATATWVGTVAPYTYTLALTGVTASNNVELSVPSTITLAQFEALAEAQIATGTQTANSLTLKAYGDKPTIAIPITITIRGDL